jgi:hypothetical protein
MAEITVPDADELLLDRLELRTPSQVNRSVWTGRRKVVGLPGTETWTGTVSLADINTEEAERQWRAFVFALGGPENWFRWPLPCASHPGAKPTVAAGAGDGYSLPLTGMTPSTTILQAGQFMTVPLPSGYYRTVCLIAPLTSDGSGNATAQFRPALNEIPAEGATVETLDPFIRMAPVEGLMGFANSEGSAGTSFEVEEAFGSEITGALPTYYTFDDAEGPPTFDMTA